MKIIITALTGLFFLMGAFVNKIFKSKNLSFFSCSLALIVLINLIVFDIFPDIMHSIDIVCLILFIFGLFISKIFDLFVPNHSHHHVEKNDNIDEHNHHLEHISIISLMTLIVHNLIESIALYNVLINSLKSGIMMSIAIALHNLPLGLQMGNLLKDKKKIWLYILSLTGLCGAMIATIIGNGLEMIEVYILSFTLGMLVYLCFFEILKEVWESRKNKYTKYGILIGIIIVIGTLLI